MSHKDVYFLGFLALAYLYLDQRATASPAQPRLEPGESPAPGRPLEIRIVPRDACPRNAAHPVTLRHDGAMWCRGCDQAYYPRMAEWDAGLADAAA